MTPPAVTRESVYDTREVQLGVAGVPDLPTPSGNDPIQPYSVRLTFSIPRRECTSITVLGWLDREGGPRRRRRVNLNTAPEWLATLVEFYRPVSP